jgi:hypothetical protein
VGAVRLPPLPPRLLPMAPPLLLLLLLLLLPLLLLLLLLLLAPSFGIARRAPVPPARCRLAAMVGVGRGVLLLAATLAPAEGDSPVMGPWGKRRAPAVWRTASTGAGRARSAARRVDAPLGSAALPLATVPSF